MHRNPIQLPHELCKNTLPSCLLNCLCTNTLPSCRTNRVKIPYPAATYPTAYVPSCLPTQLPTYRAAYLPSCLPTHLPTCIRTQPLAYRRGSAATVVHRFRGNPVWRPKKNSQVSNFGGWAMRFGRSGPIPVPFSFSLHSISFAIARGKWFSVPFWFSRPSALPGAWISLKSYICMLASATGPWVHLWVGIWS